MTEIVFMDAGLFGSDNGLCFPHCSTGTYWHVADKGKENRPGEGKLIKRFLRTQARFCSIKYRIVFLKLHGEMGRYLKPLTLIEATESKSGHSAACSKQEANQWVHLISLPDAFSHDEALLLTRLSEDEWLAWVPDYGEVTLHISEFYFAHDLN